ncbi:hypothetical protein M2159_008538 [Streptomyces sp. SAI-090]|nr:hypothetical protein [Streptomyces sp. SAI-090]
MDSFLRPVNEAAAPPARASQNASVPMETSDSIHPPRQYSLSNAPGDRLRRPTDKSALGGTPATPAWKTSGRLRQCEAPTSALRESHPTRYGRGG